MLRSVKALRGYTVLAQDGDIGKMYDFYFNDAQWNIRYLVVDTSHWLTGRKVLIAPGALGKPNWVAFTFPVLLTKAQVEKSPDINTDRPVSRQQEADLHAHYGWPLYWLESGPGDSPVFMPPPPPPVPETRPASSKAGEEKSDSHLRSVKEVTGYHIHASDGMMGHVEDFIVDDAIWVVRYIVVHTGNWLPAKKVLLSPQWLQEISHPDRRVDVNLKQETILRCPEFHPGELVNREYEERLYDYYGRPGYWEEPADPAKSKH